MAITPFRPVSWSPNEPITDAKMDRIGDDLQYLFDHFPRTVYRAHGVRRAEGLKIMVGTAFIGARKKPYARVEVYFGDNFSHLSKPIVTTGIVSAHQHRIYCTINGLNGLHPDNRGFTAHVVVDALDKKNRKIARSLYVNWMALGI
jgi:hypothetical protein